ncbi:4-hydroxy-2-oxovalerate aldolase [Phycicoccus sp. HDW14]|uniref:4-hydroxy-2-oxovalerate aldolase n=1 Tax=Phycicoccus sp. HDW14 TaxID=2714941 RepID=UPI001F10D6C7|nr:4-hydroxy-2-oxovalerate aldolase [Phycicoccus sp. HDW14]
MQHQFTEEQVRGVVHALDAAGVQVIEVSHGDGLGGSSFNYGFSKVDEMKLIAAAVDEATRAKIAILMLPGLGTLHDLRNAHAAGASVARIATHCTEADVSIQHFGAARALGMETVGFLMLSHKASPATLAQQARIMVDAGAQCVYVVDSAGALVLTDAQERITAVIDEIGQEAQVGFHGHQNLSLGIANSVLAHQAGALQIDGALCALGAGAGNSPTEVLAATFERMGIRTGIDLGEVLSAAEDVVRPFIPRLPWMDRSSITQGYAGVYSSFLLHAERAAERYDVPAHEILTKVGEYGYVGGQEDMIIDIALQLAEEKHQLLELGDLAGMGSADGRCAFGGWTVESVAAELLACEDERREREPFTDEWPGLDLDTGYAVQDLTLQKRIERGEKLIGVKLGLTSRAKQQRMGVHFPFVAWLTDAMVLPVGDPVPQGRLIHPRIEPEIVFLMGERLEGPGVTCAQAMSAVESVWGGAEVIDSRYKDFRFTAGDVAADNASSGAFVTGPVGVPRPTSTSRSRRSSSRSAGSSPTRRPVRRSRGTPARRWPWPPTTWPGAATPSRRAGSC